MKQQVKIAVVQYQAEKLHDWQAYQTKITKLVADAAESKADIILLPEYAGLELLSWYQGKNGEAFNHLETLLPQFIKLYQSLAKQYRTFIQPGTLLAKISDQQFVNRAYFFGPQGDYGFQDKNHLTRSEKSDSFITRNYQLNIFNTVLGRIGIAICYDVEFPKLVHQLVNAGCNIILVPSLTESIAGFYRVHLSCRARALENQCYVAQSSLIGSMPWCDFTSPSVGRSGIFGPVDQGFPDDGILALANWNEPITLYAEIDLSALKIVRREGQVTNFDDMQTLAQLNELPISYFDLA